MDRQSYSTWNKGKLVGQKLPLKQRDIWSIPVRLQLANRARDLALFNLAIDSKLRGCDLVALRVKDLGDSQHISGRAIVMQQKTKRPVQFEITEGTRQALLDWIKKRGSAPMITCCRAELVSVGTSVRGNTPGSFTAWWARLASTGMPTGRTP
jgi:integrase